MLKNKEDVLKMKANAYRQLCWHCTHPIGEKMCSKFKYGVLPKGAVLDEENYIIECPLFENNSRKPPKTIAPHKKILRSKIVVEYFKISRTNYYEKKQMWDEKYEAETGKKLPYYVKIKDLCEVCGISRFKYYSNQDYWEQIYRELLNKKHKKEDLKLK